jgi:hypothetical protein
MIPNGPLMTHSGHASHVRPQWRKRGAPFDSGDYCAGAGIGRMLDTFQPIGVLTSSIFIRNLPSYIVALRLNGWQEESDAPKCEADVGGS